MALSDDDYTELQGILQALEPKLDTLYDKARGFVSDQIEREKRYGQDMFMSTKQWKWLRDLNAEFGSPPPAKGYVAGKMSDDEAEGKIDLDDSILF